MAEGARPGATRRPRARARSGRPDTPPALRRPRRSGAPPRRRLRDRPAQLVERLLRLAGIQRRVRSGGVLLASVLLAAAVIVLGAGAAYAYVARDLPSIEGFGTDSLSQVTRIYASDGTTLLEERYPNGQNRTVVDLAHISRDLQHATISVEDKDFYSHPGVDLPRIVGAGLYDLTHRQAAQGASTITQQVVKLALLQLPDRTLSRKVKELVLALQLESRYSKSQILEMYLNTIYYGNGAYGIESASEKYFGVHARDLTLPEASFLAGLPQSPGRYNPFSADGYVAARARQQVVLHAMVAAGYVTPATAASVAATDLQPALRAAQQAGAAPRLSLAPHFVDYVIALLRERLGGDVVDRGGLTVITTLDPRAQDLATRAVQKEVPAAAKSVRTVTDSSGQQAGGPNNGAALVLSPKTGAILAMVGSVDYNDMNINGSVNNTVAPEYGGDLHQVGSTFKAYTYSTALASGYSPGSGLLDAGTPPGCAAGYHPQDFDGRQLGGISLAYSLQQSRNISSIRLFQALGPSRVFATAQALGVKPQYLKETGCTATLGSNYMPMIDHVAAYGAIANGGRRLHPWAIARVTDTGGHVLEDNRAPSTEQVVPASVTLQLTTILKGAVPPQYHMGIPMAAKSGTTEWWHDSWFIGYTTDMVIGAWMGHAGPHSEEGHMNELWGDIGAGLVMEDFLKGWYGKSVPPDFGAAKSGTRACVASTTPSPSASPKPSGSAGHGGPTPSPTPAYPRAPYQYATPSPSPSPGATPERCEPLPVYGSSGTGTAASPGAAPGGSPTPGEPSPTPPGPEVYTPAPTPSSKPCTLPPLCP